MASARVCCANTPNRSASIENFTIHDREDSADLMNLARHDLGFSKTESRFPAKGTCLAIYSRAVNSEEPLDEVLARSFPWCAGWSAQLRTLFAAYVEAKQAQNVLDYDDLLLYWAQMVADPDLARQIGEKFDRFWSMNIRTPTAFRPRS